MQKAYPAKRVVIFWLWLVIAIQKDKLEVLDLLISQELQESQIFK
jgi:hypothetical protein